MTNKFYCYKTERHSVITGHFRVLFGESCTTSDLLQGRVNRPGHISCYLLCIRYEDATVKSRHENVSPRSTINDYINNAISSHVAKYRKKEEVNIRRKLNGIIHNIDEPVNLFISSSTILSRQWNIWMTTVFSSKFYLMASWCAIVGRDDIAAPCRAALHRG